MMLIPAKYWVVGDKVCFDTESNSVEYCHIMTAGHNVVFANGVEAETFYVGDQSVNGFGKETREVLLCFFPERKDCVYKMEAAHPILKEHEAHCFCQCKLITLI